MKTPIKKITSLLLCSALISCSSTNKIQQVSNPNLQTKYEQNWDSLAKHEAAPQWYQDAKLGIYLHWGVYSVPAFGTEWYPRNMHFEGRKENKHHIETYGELNEFGYHDFVPMFKGEHFDAKAWGHYLKKPALSLPVR